MCVCVSAFFGLYLLYTDVRARLASCLLSLPYILITSPIQSYFVFSLFWCFFFHHISSMLFKSRDLTRAEYDDLALARYSFQQRDFLQDCLRMSNTGNSPDPKIAASAVAIPAPPSTNSMEEGSMICFGSREPLVLQVSYRDAGPPHTIKLEQPCSTTDLLFACIKEFIRKSSDTDPRFYELHAITRASVVARDFLATTGLPQAENASAPELCLWPTVPLWMYSIQSGDMIELVRSPGTENATTPPKVTPRIVDGGMTLMIVLAEGNNATTTITVPAEITAGQLMQAVNSFAWAKIGVQFKPVHPKYLRYYAFFTYQKGRWVELPSRDPIRIHRLPELSILLLKRRNVVEIEYVCASGHLADFFSTEKLDYAMAKVVKAMEAEAAEASSKTPGAAGAAAAGPCGRAPSSTPRSPGCRRPTRRRPRCGSGRRSPC